MTGSRADGRWHAPLRLALIVAVVAWSLLPATVSSDSSPTALVHAHDYELADVCIDGLPWTGDEPLAVPGPKPRDHEGVPMYRVDGSLYYRPGALAINGMKRLDAYRDSADEEQLEQALKQADRLRRMTLDRRDASWLPFWYDYLPAGQHAPWFNAMTQGLVLSFYVRLHHVTGDALHLEAAEGVMRSFYRRGRQDEPWVAYVDEEAYLWLEHYPLRDPDHVLNAHIHAVIGIYEYWQATRSTAAERLLDTAIATVRHHAGRYRRPGGISLYGLSSRSLILKYHEIHVWQLELLSKISNDPWFADMADQLRRDRRSRRDVNGRPAREDLGVVGPHCRPQTTPTPSSVAAARGETPSK